MAFTYYLFEEIIKKEILPKTIFIKKDNPLNHDIKNDC